MLIYVDVLLLLWSLSYLPYPTCVRIVPVHT